MPLDGRQGRVSSKDRRSRTKGGSDSREWDEWKAYMYDDSRSISSQRSDAGSHDAAGMGIESARAEIEHGYHHSARSVGSTSSCGSSRGLLSPHLINGETKFPTATSYLSDAQRSDVATVCSNSVVEDIEEESVISADLNAQSTTTSATLNSAASPPSSVRMMMTSARPLQLLKPSDNPEDNLSNSGVNARDTASPVMHDRQLQLAYHQNTMGPPLSRSLLLQQQHPQHPSSGHQDSLSVAGSVAAQVDTDDCGGSIDIELHSLHSQAESQEDDGGDSSQRNYDDNPESADESSSTRKPPVNCTNNNNNDANTNGRTSPGGTIYKGRGNRRYQGRFMKLPLIRFHHDGVYLGENEPATITMNNNNHLHREDDTEFQHTQSSSSSSGFVRNEGRKNERRRTGDGSSNPSRRRSRSRSRSRSRERGADEADRKPKSIPTRGFNRPSSEEACRSQQYRNGKWRHGGPHYRKGHDKDERQYYS